MWNPGPKGLWPSHGAVAVRWIEDNLIFPEGDFYGEPFRLRPDQKLFLYEWYEYCQSCGQWRYDEGLRGAATGDGKTTFVAAIAILEFAGPPQITPKSPNVVIAAASWEQADELFAKAGEMLGGKDDEVTEAPLCGLFNVMDSEITRRDGRPGIMKRIAAVAGTNEGGLPTLFLADELHEWGDVGSKKARVYTVVGKSTRKRRTAAGSGRKLGLSTAGFDIDHSFLGSMYKRGKKAQKNPKLAPRFLFRWFEAPDGLKYERKADRIKAVKAASPGAGSMWSITDRVNDWGKADMPPHEWIRYYANRWVDVASESWLKDHPGAWGECEGTWTSRPTNPFVLAIDMALNRDSVAVNRIEELPDGRYAVTAKVWKPKSKTEPIDHQAVWAYIVDQAKGEGFRGVVYDPRFFELPARLLEERGILAVQFDQHPARMAPACGYAYDAILGQRVVHDGDIELGTSVKAAVKMPQERGGFTLKKSKSKRPIDACIAFVMGLYVLAEVDDLEDAGPNLW
jgi:phage terminase large subunit-like protein